MTSANGRTRLNLDLPDPVIARIEIVRHMTNAASMSEVIRVALATYEAIVRMTKEEDAKVVIYPKNGESRQLILPI